MLADAYYCNYFLIATLQAAGVDVVFEQNGSRISDFRHGQKLGPRDHVVRWAKSKHRPRWMSLEQYKSFPDEIIVRELEADGRILVSTLIKPREAPRRALLKLYQQRWQVELDLRNIKTTLGMNLLSCNTPQMNEKELWVHLLAYNLIRLLMAQAARNAAVHPRELSFKHTLQMWTEWASNTLRESPMQCAEFFRLIAQLTVGNRPGRLEPRARKRRPKPYQWLKVPREKARRQICRHGYLPNPST
jgi:hypothetical protein